MAVLRDKEEEKGQGTSQALGQPVPGQMQPQEQAEPQQAQPSGPATIGGSSATQTSAPVKAMPKQQKAGTGSFANLKTYLQAAQGGGQQRVAQAATQQVQRLGAGAQKGVQQAQESFGRQMQAGSLAGMETAGQEASDIVKTARGVTYQAPQATTPVLTQEQINAQNEARANPPLTQIRVGGPAVRPEDQRRRYEYEQYLKNTLGDKESQFLEELGSLSSQSNDINILKNKADEIYNKYGVKKASEFSIPISTQSQAAAQPQQYFTPEQQQRFAEIINAQYQGPASLQQAGLYEQAARKARTAQQAGELTQTAGGREQLLRDVFGRGRDYSRGASRLDALLLNASEQGVQQLQQQAQPALQSQQSLQAAQNLSANEAAQRAAAIEQIRSGARTAFTEARTAEEKAVDERLSQVVENWNQLPDYFKNILREREKGALALSEQEAGLLGIKAGQGLYNLTPDELIQTQAAERERLITKDELSRQLALQQLANLDVNRQLQKDLLYSDLEKAGTQTAEDAINKQAIQDVLKAQELAFQETAAGQTLVGTGSKKHRQTGKRYYADASANLKDLLQQAGYKFAPTEGMTPEDVASGVTGSVTQDQDQLGLVGEALLPYGSGASTAEQAATAYADLATGGATAALRGLGLDVTGALARNLGGTVSSKYAKNIAKRNAARDLQAKITQALDTAGFTNRVALRDNEQTKARQAALEQILAAREKLRG